MFEWRRFAAPDYIGPNAESHLGDRIVPKLLGRGVRVVGDPDVTHSWTYTVDAAHDGRGGNESDRVGRVARSDQHATHPARSDCRPSHYGGVPMIR